MPKTEVGPKPQISKEAKERMRRFMEDLEALQRRHGVELGTMDDAIGLRDMRRTDDWGGYGEWDALISNCNDAIGRVRLRNLQFEQFNLWGK